MVNASKKKTAAPLAGGKTIGATALGRALGISRERVYQLTRDGKIAREPDGQFDLDAVRAALKRNLDIRQAAPSRGDKPEALEGPAPPSSDKPPGGVSLATVQLQHEIAKTTKAQLEVKRLKGINIDALEAKQAWGQHIITVKSRLLGFAPKLAPRLASENDVLACQEIIDHEIRAVLTELSEYQPDA